MSKIVLGDQDNLLDSVPDYWKRCLSAAAANSSPEELGMCRLTSSIRIPLSPSATTHLPTEPAPESQYPRVIPGVGLVYRVGNGVIAPRALFSPDPDYSPAARAARIHGSNKMTFVVDESGGVRNIEIIRPLGCGLDEKAVQAVQTWKFDPALKDGKPVSVLISIDVGFRFY